MEERAHSGGVARRDSPVFVQHGGKSYVNKWKSWNAGSGEKAPGEPETEQDWEGNARLTESWGLS